MPLTLNNTNTLTADNIIVSGTDLSDLYATKTELGDINTANSSNIATNTADIAVLNTKQLQNFHNISSVTHLLDTEYQTNATLTSTFYNKTEIDTTFTNYYTQTQIDTNLSTNFQTNTQLATNYYNKGEVDTLVAGAGGGGGYTDTEIDNLLALRVPLSDFTNRFSANPIIDCSAPTVIHSGLTLNNSTINISPVEGLLFSNQTGGGDKVLAEFKNATSYITLQGDKIFCNNTSDDAIKQLDLTNNNAGYKMSGKIEAPTGGIVVENTADANLSFTVRNTDNYITFNNDSIDCYNSVGDTGRILSINANADQYVKTHSLLVDTGANALTGGYTLDVVDSAIIRQNLKVDGNLDLTNDLNFDGENANISNNSGLTFYKDTTDASNVMTIKNAQGYIKFNSYNINAYNTSNDSSSLLLLNTANGNGVYCLSLGIGVIQGSNKLNVSGGNANFGSTASFQSISTFHGDIYVNNSGRIFQRADANNSLNVISTEEINFSLQSNRTTDPTTATIALQLNDTNGITLNRAVTNNLTFNSIGNIVGESDVVSWGRFMFQNSSELKEVLDTQYKLYIRNGDTAGEMNLTIGLESSTPEIQLTDGKINLLGNLEITHTDVSGSQRVLINNPDTDGFIRLSNNNLSRLDATNTGVDVYGFFTTTNNADIGGNLTCVALTETSDALLKENIKEVNIKECYKAVKYIKPKTYNFINDESKKSHIGFVADDLKDAKMPKEWDNIIYYNDDGMKLLAYNKSAVVLWGCVQELMKEVEDLKKEVKKLKGETSPKARAKPKAKSKN